MKTDKLTRLISALGKPEHQNRAEQKAIQEQTRVAKDTDAVKISSTISGDDPQAADRTPRQRKVAAIKAQIEQGVYDRTSEEIATSVIKELGL